MQLPTGIRPFEQLPFAGTVAFFEGTPADHWLRCDGS